jgi:hypothetical protein
MVEVRKRDFTSGFSGETDHLTGLVAAACERIFGVLGQRGFLFHKQ